MKPLVALACVVRCAVWTGVLGACDFPRPADVAGDSGAHDGGKDGRGDAATLDAATSTDAAPPLPFLSCFGLPATCGTTGNDSCCKSLPVPGGSYYRSYDVAPDSTFKDTSAPATVSDFRLDKYLVTVGRFRTFVNAGMGTQLTAPPQGAGAHVKIAGSGWDVDWDTSLAVNTAALMEAVKCDPSNQTWTDVPAGNEHRPLNCVMWYEAMAFCAWDGGYLPTNAEWNYAAAGGDEQRAYPWSSPASSISLDRSQATYDCTIDEAPACMFGLTAVGTRPAGDGRWGQSDLVGNVFEWMLDWNTPYETPCTDCAALTSPYADGSTRQFRGGSFNSAVHYLRIGERSAYTLRCAPLRTGFVVREHREDTNPQHLLGETIRLPA